MSLTIPQYKVPTIYVFTFPFYKNAKWEQGAREGKGILKIGSKTIIDHCIQILEESNINNIYISVNHLKHKIISYINKKKSKLNFNFVEEKKKLGTVVQ